MVEDGKAHGVFVFESTGRIGAKSGKIRWGVIGGGFQIHNQAKRGDLHRQASFPRQTADKTQALQQQDAMERTTRLVFW